MQRVILRKSALDLAIVLKCSLHNSPAHSGPITIREFYKSELRNRLIRRGTKISRHKRQRRGDDRVMMEKQIR